MYKWRGNLLKSVNFGEFWWPNCEALFQTKSGKNFSAFIVLMSAKFHKQGDESKQNFVAWRNFMLPGRNFISLKQSFAFLKWNFVSWKGNFIQDWVENCSVGQIGDVTFSIRVRIVYKSWSRSLVSSIKSSVQKTSSLTHRLQAPDRFCKKDENLFRFVPWQCFALAFSLKALLYLQSFWNGRPRKSNKRCKPFHFNCKARNAL